MLLSTQLKALIKSKNNTHIIIVSFLYRKSCHHRWQK